ncbi:conserved hypothetical protein [Ricinus communis]|uniref:Uncharacterized protein n=1 Tax=Ricinus communis TaxID=3988 RepID=B9RY11_RICCO|nr:conserved hypothetical protein [Ricinus communis]
MRGSIKNEVISLANGSRQVANQGYVPEEKCDVLKSLPFSVSDLKSYHSLRELECL